MFLTCFLLADNCGKKLSRKYDSFGNNAVKGLLVQHLSQPRQQHGPCIQD